mmetsp:Transcript_10305/g.20767  ORF Transcript_10305/g.20767 Transcript_10305/m.20767 type:complete len:252 (+) Transcript_10305:1425-2180(+)
MTLESYLVCLSRRWHEARDLVKVLDCFNYPSKQKNIPCMNASLWSDSGDDFAIRARDLNKEQTLQMTEPSLNHCTCNDRRPFLNSQCNGVLPRVLDNSCQGFGTVPEKQRSRYDEVCESYQDDRGSHSRRAKNSDFHVREILSCQSDYHQIGGRPEDCECPSHDSSVVHGHEKLGNWDPRTTRKLLHHWNHHGHDGCVVQKPARNGYRHGKPHQCRPQPLRPPQNVPENWQQYRGATYPFCGNKQHRNGGN